MQRYSCNKSVESSSKLKMHNILDLILFYIFVSSYLIILLDALELAWWLKKESLVSEKEKHTALGSELRPRVKFFKELLLPLHRSA